jgi:hypothetical protein
VDVCFGYYIDLQRIGLGCTMVNPYWQWIRLWAMDTPVGRFAFENKKKLLHDVSGAMQELYTWGYEIIVCHSKSESEFEIHSEFNTFFIRCQVFC